MTIEKKEIAMGKWIALDGGTTHTRIRLMNGERIVAEVKCPAGAGDTARTGTIATLRDAVRDGIQSVLAEGAYAAEDVAEIIASGMIGSELGLHNVPHISGIINVTALATQGDAVTLPEITPIPFYFVPGVRNRPQDRLDLMRGEETECMGLMALMGASDATCSVLLPGSHNKMVRVSRGRIMACYTAMSGEVLSVIATQTLLKSALPAKWPLPMHDELLEGYRDAEQYGLMHALFHVRLMQTQMRTSADARFSYFFGSGTGRRPENDSGVCRERHGAGGRNRPDENRAGRPDRDALRQHDPAGGFGHGGAGDRCRGVARPVGAGDAAKSIILPGVPSRGHPVFCGLHQVLLRKICAIPEYKLRGKSKYCGEIAKPWTKQLGIQF